MLVNMSSTFELFKANILRFWPHFINFCVGGSWMETCKRITDPHLQCVSSIVEKCPRPLG